MCFEFFSRDTHTQPVEVINVTLNMCVNSRRTCRSMHTLCVCRNDVRECITHVGLVCVSKMGVCVCVEDGCVCVLSVCVCLVCVSNMCVCVEDDLPIDIYVDAGV